MIADEEAIKPLFVDESQQKQKLVDLSVIKRGLHHHSQDQSKHLKKQQHISQENLIPSTSNLQAMAGPGESQLFAANDLLKMEEVTALPDDVDTIVGSLKTVDFAVQDLDVLIELSKQLKYKRL